jgi:FkbM family methyltransferase
MLLQKTAKLVSGAVGRQNALIQALRPVYERVLDIATGGRGYQRTVNGLETFYVHPRWRRYFPDTYEPNVFDYLRARIKPGSISLNVGAHVGVYTLCMARWSGPTGRVYSFEPNGPTRAVLQSHVVRNGFQSRVTVLSDAVSDRCGEADFLAADLAGTSRLGACNPESNDVHIKSRVSLTTVDTFCAAHGLLPDWILIDIEGYEVAALRGARKMIDQCRGQLGIVVEMHPFLWENCGESRASFEELLKELKLNPVGLTGQSDPLTVNGVAELRPT